MLSKTQTFFVWLSLLMLTACMLKFSTNSAVAQDIAPIQPPLECPPCPQPPPCPNTSPVPDMGAVQKALESIERAEKSGP